MDIVCTDGRVLTMALDEADGTGSRRLPAARLEAKFRETAGSRVSAAEVERLIGVCRGIEGLKSKEVLF
jgi:hypothetical protein